MYRVVEFKNNHIQTLKSGFKTPGKANVWAAKNLPLDKTNLWGKKPPFDYKYSVMKG